MSTDAERKAGQVEGRLYALEQRVDRGEVALNKRLDDMDAKMDAVLEKLNGWSGAQRAILWVSVPAMAAVGWLTAHYWPFKPLP